MKDWIIENPGHSGVILGITLIGIGLGLVVTSLALGFIILGTYVAIVSLIIAEA